MSEQIETFLHEVPDWKEIISSEKFVLFDSDAVIAILKYKADGVMDEFHKKGVSCFTIHPVEVELKRTNSQNERSARELWLQKHDVGNYPFWKDESIMKKVEEIRMYLQNLGRYPTPIDLYLGAIIGKFSTNKKTYLLTGNTNDFPLPLFRREAYIILQTKFTYKILVFLSVDLGILENFSKAAAID